MKLLPGSVLFLIAIAAFAPFAQAQTPDYYYNGTTAASNFNSDTVWLTVNGTPIGNSPGVGDTAIVATGGTYDGEFVDLNLTTTITLSNTQNNTVQGLEFTSYNAGTTNFQNTSGYTFTITGRPNDVGTGTPLVGDLNIDGGAIVNYTGASSTMLVNSGLIVVGGSSLNGNDTNNAFTPSGTFNIKSGTFSFDPAAGTSTEMDVGSGNGGFFGSTATGTVVQGAAASGSTAATASTVVTGNILNIGFNGGSGTWNVTNGSLLETGTEAGVSYVIAIGANSSGNNVFGGTSGNSSGTLTISDSSTFNVGSNSAGTSTGADLQLGAVATGADFGTAGGTGTMVQNGTQSTVNIMGTSTVELGAAAGGYGQYQLQAGNLNIGTNATDAVTFTVGAAAATIDNGTSTGILTQSGTGTMTVGNAAGNATTFTVGGAVGSAGNGTYMLSGGTAIFNTALTIGATGSMSLSAAVDDNGNVTSVGTLVISDVNLTAGATNATTGTGSFTFSGGTLDITTAGTGTVYTFPYTNASTLAANTTTTIDTTLGTGTFATFNFAENLSGGGGINFIGTAGTTTFNLTGTSYSFTGMAAITSGTLNATVDQLTNASTLGVGATGVLNLNTTAGGASSIGTLEGASGGVVNITYDPTNTTLELKGTTNAYLGAINVGADGVTAGTLQLFSGTLGTITEDEGGNNLTIGGDATVATSGTVTIGANNLSGLITINPKFTLNAPNLDGDVVNAGVLNVTGEIGLTNANTITNTGELNAGSIAGTVTSNTGDLTTTTIGGDVTSNSGVLTATDVTGSVTNTGKFDATGVGDSLVNIGGTIGLPSNTPVGSTLAITGTLTSTLNGTIDIRANGNLAVPVADLITATGTATVATTNTIFVTGSGNITVPIAIISAGGGLTVGGLPMVATQSALLYTAALTEDANNIYLTTTQLPVGTFAKTPNEKAVAAPIDTDIANPGMLTSRSQQTAFNDLLVAFNRMRSGTQVASALDALSPESLQYSRNIAFENSTFLAQSVDGYLSNLRSGYTGIDASQVNYITPGFDNSLTRSMGSMLAYSSPSGHGTAPNGVNYYPDDGVSSSPSPSSAAPMSDSSGQTISDSPVPLLTPSSNSGLRPANISEFIGGDVVLADLNKDQSASNAAPSSAKYTAGDVTAGVAFRMTNHFSAGVLFDYNHTDAKTDSNGSKTTVDTYSPGLFATYFDHGFYVNGLFSFGYNNYSNNRSIPFLGETANSSPTGQQYVTDLDGGYDFHPATGWVVGPTLGAVYTHLDIDSFTETDAPGAELAVNSESLDSLRSRLGGHLMYQTNTGDVILQPNVFAMWQHEFLDNNSGITSSFSDFNSNAFTINTPAPGKDSALIGLGMTATLSNSLAVYLNYLADVGANDYFAQSIIGGVKARF